MHFWKRCRLAGKATGNLGAIGTSADLDIKKRPEAISRLEQFKFTVVIIGHGDRLDIGLIQHTLDLLAVDQP